MVRIVDAENHTLYATAFDLDPTTEDAPDVRSFEKRLVVPYKVGSEALIIYHENREVAALEIPTNTPSESQRSAC
ncbi:hypothetical protein ACFQGT_18150 [Natrialbaceae archaeon GCM10025810]|uniref:hypothetical protein n=1 Tax=Halovalidus salilacus TaxID=3075124 RepID=UPI0036192BB3